jgi:hypothetical protein
MRSIIYKEWIKIRWTFLAFLVLGIVALAIMFLKVRHDILFVDAVNYWYSFLFRGYPYFSLLKFLPLVAGLGIALAQYFPETVSKRIKLTFHLPVRENEILLKMHAFGAGCIIGMFLFFFLIFVAGSFIYFPSEIIRPSLITIAPWFLGGLATYFITALVLLEPIWLYRGLYTVVGAGFITFFYSYGAIGAYKPVLLSLAILTLLLSIVVLFSGYRFRKGEM